MVATVTVHFVRPTICIQQKRDDTPSEKKEVLRHDTFSQRKINALPTIPPHGYFYKYLSFCIHYIPRNGENTSVVVWNDRQNNTPARWWYVGEARFGDASIIISDHIVSTNQVRTIHQCSVTYISHNNATIPFQPHHSLSLHTACIHQTNFRFSAYVNEFHFSSNAPILSFVPGCVLSHEVDPVPP